MADEIIEVTIGSDGRVEIHVDGIPGMDCLGETDDLVRLLGGEIESQQLTGEAYVDTSQEQQDRQWH